MKVIAGDRRSGRTTELIKLCAEAEKNGEVAYLVCHSQMEARRVFKQAREMGYESFRFPVSYEEFLNSHGKSFTTRYYIDNAEFLLQMLTPIPIAGIAVTTGEEYLSLILRSFT